MNPPKKKAPESPRARTGAMIIRDVRAVNLTIPYNVPYRPAWQPGLVRDNRTFTVVKIVGMSNAFAVFARAVTLLMTIVGS